MIKKLKQKIKDFLIWSQKYTETDMVYLARGGFWLTLGQVVSTSASFLLAIAFANLLDPITYGNYKYILSLAGILTIFSLPGIGTAIIQAVARGFEGSFYSGFKTKLKWSLLGSLAAIGLAGYYFFRGNYTLPIPLFISAIFLPLWEASTIYGSFLRGKKLFNFQVQYGTLSQIISTTTLITTLFLTKNLFWLIAVYFVSNTFLNYFLYLFTQKKFQPNKKEDPQTLSYGKHLSLMDLISAIAGQIDKVLLFTLIGSTQLAIYSFAIIIPDQIRSILEKVDILAFPKLAIKSREEIRVNMMQKFWKLFLLTVITIALYIVIAPYLYKIFFPQYLASLPYSQFFIFSLISFPATLMGVSLKAKMMRKELYLFQFLPAIRLILLVFLIPFYGIWGAIIALVGMKVFNLFFTLFLFRRI